MLIAVITSLLIAFGIWPAVNMVSLPVLSNTGSPNSGNKRVSVLVPLRNEEKNIPNLLKSLENLTYSNTEYLLLDDQSDDNTLSLLEKGTCDWSNIKIIHGKPLPKGWSGKVHACHQLSGKAGGEIYFFLDADVSLHPETITAVSALLEKSQAGMVTGFPHFPIKGLLSSILVPMQHFLVYFHLPIRRANTSLHPAFTAAHGSFIAVFFFSYFLCLCPEKRMYH
ncbi:glycosyltransferase family 2 protein [Alteribacillus sp. HJP-4]|uniref:glycosyltransferase family 2 protein n=1 Tax=Alteribacillus sp. HJP-4 TaxID=2775394 RepID=UPI0035CD2A17